MCAREAEQGGGGLKILKLNRESVTDGAPIPKFFSRLNMESTLEPTKTLIRIQTARQLQR